MYTILAICAVVTTSIIVYVGYILANTLKIAQKILEDVEDTTHDVRTLKDGVKFGVLKILKNSIDKYLTSSEVKK